jgi:hypothetical protein
VTWLRTSSCRLQRGTCTRSDSAIVGLSDHGTRGPIPLTDNWPHRRALHAPTRPLHESDGTALSECSSCRHFATA